MLTPSEREDLLGPVGWCRCRGAGRVVRSERRPVGRLRHCHGDPQLPTRRGCETGVHPPS